MKKILAFDPSWDTCGAAIYNLDEKFLTLYSGNIMKVLSDVNQWNRREDIMAVVLEDPNLDSSVFGAWEAIRKAIASRQPMAQIKSIANTWLKHAQRVGESKASAKYIDSWCHARGFPVIRIAPSWRDKATNKRKAQFPINQLIMPTKTNQDQFKELTGWAGKSNEHTRDAATMIHGRTAGWVETMLSFNSQMYGQGKGKNMKKDVRDMYLGRLGNRITNP